MSAATDIRDVNYCLRKADEYREKAKGTVHRNLRSAFEAAAREYDSRAKENAERISRFSRPRKPVTKTEFTCREKHAQLLRKSPAASQDTYAARRLIGVRNIILLR